MRRLAEPSVVAAAAIAAAGSALLSLPRLQSWENRPFPVWFPVVSIFFCGFVLWAFVFAWHTLYTHRPLFTLRIKPAIFAAATLAGILAGLSTHWLIDPAERLRNPQEYPVDFSHWVGHTLFALSLVQLLLLFAPFAWAMRLFRNETVAIWITVAFSVLVLILKASKSPTPLPALLLLQLLISRIIFGYFAVWIYVRGGIFIAWWIALLFEARHLLTFAGV